jgi:hypothetical protein
MPDFIPSREADLSPYVLNVSTRATATPTAFGLTAGQATTFAGLVTAWNTAFDAVRDPGARTPAAIITKNAAKRALIANLRMLAGIIQKFPGTTDTMRSELGLTVPKPPSPEPVPEISPVVEVVRVNGHTVTLRISDPTSPTRRGKPPQVDGISVFSFIGAEAPVSIDPWKWQGATTKTQFDVVFDATVVPGAKVWFTALFFNRRKMTGPACTPISTNIGFGGVVTAEAA